MTDTHAFHSRLRRALALIEDEPDTVGLRAAACELRTALGMHARIAEAPRWCDFVSANLALLGDAELFGTPGMQGTGIAIRYDLLNEYADKHRLHFNDLCRVVREATAGVQEPRKFDPNRVQICRVAPIDYDNGQPCICAEGTCSLWKGGLRPADVKTAASPVMCAESGRPCTKGCSDACYWQRTAGVAAPAATPPPPPEVPAGWRRVGWTVDTSNGSIFIFDTGVTLSDEQQTRWKPAYTRAPGVKLPDGAQQ